MRKLGFAFVFIGLLLIVGSAVLYWKTSGLAEVPTAVLELERKLARPGLIALATLDVAALVELGVGEEAAAEDEGLRREISAAGVDLAHDVTHATLALTSSDDGRAEAAFALFGRFDAAAIEAALRDREDLRVSEAKAAGEAVLHVIRIDRETCAESGPWAVHLRPERLLVASARAIAPILGAAASEDRLREGALRDLTRFQDFRSGQLVSAAFFVPDQLPDTGNFMVGMAAYGAKQQVEGFRALYAGAAPQLLPPGVAVDAVLEGTRPGIAGEKAAAWQAWLDDKLGAASEKVPTLATLHDALELRAEGNDLHATFRLSKQDIERLEKLPEEMGSLIFGGSSFELSSGDDVAVERLDEDPQVFQPQVGEASIAAYDPSVLFAEPVDRAVGPFGVRLAAIRLGEGGGPNELEIEAFGTSVPNLGDSGDRVSLAITGIESRDGEELLAREHCGADRNDLPAQLSNHFGGDVLTGAKSVRLRAGAEPDDVAQIAGTVTLRLPTRTETVELAAEPAVVERAGARLEISKVAGSSLSYTVGGEAGNLLHLRALNAAGKPLAGNGKSSMSGFGSGRSSSETYAGTIDAVEAIFALEQETLRYPFELSETRPGTNGEHLAQASTGDASQAAVAISGAFEDWLARVVGPVSEAAHELVGGETLAATRAGPFQVELKGLWSFGGLMPRIEVRAPEIPGVEGSPSAVELRLDELRMADGTVQQGSWSEALAMSKGFGKDGLVGTSQLETGASGSSDDVASLRGRLAIRLPARVVSERLSDVGLGAGVETKVLSVELSELGRDRFVLRAHRGGERLIGARAFNGSGEALWTEPEGVERTQDGALELGFQAKGVPREIELRLADELALAEYPFVLTLRDRKVARVR